MPLRSGKNSKQQKKHLAAAQKHLCSRKNAFWRQREKTVRGGKKPVRGKKKTGRGRKKTSSRESPALQPKKLPQRKKYISATGKSSSPLVTVLIILTKAGGNLRFIALLDSRVVKGAQVKGRSSSTALRGTLQKSCALQLAGNPYPSFGFAPTRLKKTDAPTRFKDLPDTAEFSILDVLYFEQIRSLHAMQFSKPTANWIRFFILILSCFNVFKHPLSDLMDFSDASSSHHIFGF